MRRNGLRWALMRPIWALARARRKPPGPRGEAGRSNSLLCLSQNRRRTSAAGKQRTSDMSNSATSDPGQAGATFTATSEWQDVPEGAILPPGLQVMMNMTTNRQQARLMPEEPEPPPYRVDRAQLEGSAAISGLIATAGKRWVCWGYEFAQGQMDQAAGPADRHQRGHQVTRARPIPRPGRAIRAASRPPPPEARS